LYVEVLASCLIYNVDYSLAARVCDAELVVAVWPLVSEVGNDEVGSRNTIQYFFHYWTSEVRLVCPDALNSERLNCRFDVIAIHFRDGGIAADRCYNEAFWPIVAHERIAELRSQPTYYLQFPSGLNSQVPEQQVPGGGAPKRVTDNSLANAGLNKRA
jgi:hypothetical protein